jgi:hypothetical protein
MDAKPSQIAFTAQNFNTPVIDVTIWLPIYLRKEVIRA